MTILIFVAVLILLILVHELGHFIAAKLSRVKVIELGLGFPPRIFGIKRGETIYSINAVPLGGFCRMAGEEDPGVPDSLAGKSRWTRVFVLTAGSLAMLLLPLVLLPLAYAIPMERYVEGEGIQVAAVVPGTPAGEAGIEVGDIILSVDGVAVNSFEDMHEAIEPKVGSEVTLLVLRRPDAQSEITLVPRTEWPEDEGPMGIQMSAISEVRAYPPWQAIPMGFAEYGTMWVLMKDAVVMLVGGAEMPEGWEGPPVTGPIGIAQLTSEIAVGGAHILILFMCFLSVNLAIVNLLPIPALDGGRIAFILVELLRRGKRVSPHTEGLVNTVGFAVLIVLIVVVSYYDVLRLVHGGSMLP